jgi:predicted CxxxxCH...CXXCH cytochrome family protein
MRSKSNRLRSAPGRALGLALALLAAACSGERTRSQVQAAAAEGVCSPVAVHPNHAAFTCTTCHACGGVVSFDPAGAAVVAGGPAPSFDPATKTCANIACHGVPSGTYVPADYPDDPYVWTYGGGAAVTPSWIGTTATSGCTACHGYPPTANGAVWHSGWHGGVSVTSARNPDVYGYNACSTCHPGVASTVTGSGTPGGTITTTITVSSMHRNGAIDVRYFDPARWNQASCDACHYGM